MTQFIGCETKDLIADTRLCDLRGVVRSRAAGLG